jgi:thiosulfate/3-mercaptopyruvate sulfurtransferase
MSEQKHPEVLVSTEWAARHLNDDKVRFVEVDVDTTAYNQGHIPGAVGWNWQTQLQDNIRRDLIDKSALENLLGKSGISNDTTVLLYGDNNNWFAAYAFWQLKYYRHTEIRLIDGGRKKWKAENRPLTTEPPSITSVRYSAGEPDNALRAYKEDVFAGMKRKKGSRLVDVRSADEFTGKILAPPGLSETAMRGGHIPGAANIPWSLAVNEDGTFKSPVVLRQLYASHGIDERKEVITYCRIGERSSHTWFALKYLLEYPNVRNYDGSWTEWGNLVAAPIEKEVPVAVAA